jgi:hypothetical protein
MRYIQSLVLCAAIIFPAFAQAEDDVSSAPLPGLRSIPAKSVQPLLARISLTPRQVLVSIMTQGSDDAMLDEHGPAFSWVGAGETYPDKDFPDLKIQVDGQSVNIIDMSKAYDGDIDITADLKQAGLDRFEIDQDLPLSPTKSDRAMFDRLVTMSAIKKMSDSTPPLYVPHWTAVRDIMFKPGDGEHIVTLSYTPRPGLSLQQMLDVPTSVDVSAYCMTKAALVSYASQAEIGGDVVLETYDIPVSVDDKPLANVILNLSGFHSGDLGANTRLVVCGHDRKPIITAASTYKGLIQPDMTGVVHVLAVESPGVD